MKIGEALRKERLKLGLTQEQMCEGILSRMQKLKAIKIA